MAEDRNFDDIAEHFQEKIYRTPKGKIRLAVLLHDLEPVIHELPGPLRILDAGAGTGILAAHFAKQGHELVLCDISARMLEETRRRLAQEAPQAKVTLLQSPIQALDQHLQDPFDLVICHAVLEWVQDPRSVLADTVRWVKPGGCLSLMAYNRHSSVLRNLLRGNFYKVKSDDYTGEAGGLTPGSPLRPEQVLEWVQQEGLEVLSQSGVRTFYDYLPRAVREQRSLEDILELEMQFSREEPYRSMARYIHIIAQRKPYGQK